MKKRSKLLDLCVVGICFTLAFVVFLKAQTPAARPTPQATAQPQSGRETPWSYIGGDAGHTRYSPAHTRYSPG